jgi:16S rRNA (cytosine967-C5)-methyltransferase
VAQRRRPAERRRYRRPKVDAPRRAAFDVLRAVSDKDAYANLVLPVILRERAIVERDAAFATELTYGALRGQGSYDAVLSACIDRPIADVDPPVLDVLRLGTHQILAMRVPPHAAVSETVELARGVLGDGRARFVNAVLRKVSARDLESWIAAVAPEPADDRIGYLAVAFSHPPWVVQSFADALRARGRAASELEGLLVADNARPQVSLVARPGRSTLAELLASGAEPGRWSPYAAVWPAGDPTEVPAVRQRRAGVQDEGSQLVALALAAAEVDVDGAERRWLDLCAGPGGKAALLGALATERGIRLTANELQPHRVELVRAAVGDTADVVVGDGRAGDWAPASFDRVIADVPCTGLGALRRRPEARWRRRPSDLAGLGRLQRELLGAALDAVRRGGVVAYVTCSPHVAETRVVVEDVLRDRSNVEWLDARPLFGEVPELGDGPDVQLWPHIHGTDAMYLALMRLRS